MAVYFAQTPTGSIKIGTTEDLDGRLSGLESHYGQPLALLATMPGGLREEREIQGRFAHLRLGRTEQFRPGPDLLEFIGKPLLVDANPDAVEAMLVTAKALCVKLHTDVIEAARVVAALRGVQMMDMLSDILRPILAKMEGEELTRRVQSTARRKGGGK